MKFIVKFEGVPAEAGAALERMLRDDISGYPARLSMESASVEKTDVSWTDTVVKKEKTDAQPGQRKPAKQVGK